MAKLNLVLSSYINIHLAKIAVRGKGDSLGVAMLASRANERANVASKRACNISELRDHLVLFRGEKWPPRREST